MNLNSIKKKLMVDIYDSFGQVGAEIDEELDRVIETPGIFEGIPQDIIDTGQLHDSKVVMATNDRVEFEYAPVNPENGFPYAPAVWAGFYAYGGSKYIPGRRWTERAVKNIDPAERLAEIMEGKGYAAIVTSNGIDMLVD